MPSVLFRNIRDWNVSRPEPQDAMEVLVEDDRIKEVSDRPISASSARIVDGNGGTLMPGLIDCHCHVTMSEVDLKRLENDPLALMTAKTARILTGMLMHGFTTVRDCAGADWGLGPGARPPIGFP